MKKSSAFIGKDGSAFRGFQPLSANFIYCPNQFFDVCLPNCSRGVIRLVAYLLRKTLGYLDENGNPVTQDIRVSYKDISHHAGICTRAIPMALRDAESGGFISCVIRGVANRSGVRGRAAEYRLRWSEEGSDYTKDPERFDGFFSGEGHRSPIPNGFFDVVVRRETLVEAKVVGTVLRHTVGYQNQFGGRRSEAPLAMSYIQRFANIGDRTTLSNALKECTRKGYICRVSEGIFDPNAGKRSRAARYAVKWLEKKAIDRNTANTLPVESEHGKKPTEKTAKALPDEHGKKPTHGKTERKKKQQQSGGGDSSIAVAFHTDIIECLRTAGFDAKASSHLSRLQPAEEILRQIEWIDSRNPRGNRLGLLRRAIEEAWPEPPGVGKRKKQQESHEREKQRASEREKRESVEAQMKRERIEHRETLLGDWRRMTRVEQSRYRQAAIDQAKSDTVRRLLRRSTDLDNPPMDVLQQMARNTTVSIGKSVSFSNNHVSYEYPITAAQSGCRENNSRGVVVRW